MSLPSRFDDLLRLWRDGDASLEELSELEILLRGDARYRRSLARSIQLEVGLYGRHARTASSPPVRRWRMEAVAAVFAVAVSLLAVSYVLLRPEAPGRVEDGTLRVDGAPARSFRVGSSLDVPGDASARLTLKEGPEARLDGGTAGTFTEPGLFELRQGGGVFIAGPPLRVVTSAATVSGALASFSARLDLRGLRVEVAAGEVEVRYDGLRHALRAGESLTYLPLGGRTSGDLREAERRVGEAGIDLSTALRNVAGTAVEASLARDDGRVAFVARVVRDGKLREITLDAKTGAVLEDEAEGGDRTAVAAALKISLREAIAAALSKVPGVALEADAELKDGRGRVEIDILSNGRLYEVVVDPGTGALLTLGPDTP
jgi:uncharacterized membrane protein YkoI